MGSTVVQCYVEAAAGGPRRPRRELRAFAKVALAPGESTTVMLTLSPRAFAVWSPELHDWTIPPGEYTIAVGESSRSLQTAGTVTAG